MPKLNIIDRSARYLLLLSLLSIGLTTNLQAQETVSPAESTPSPDADSSTPTQSESIFSIEGGNRLMKEAEQAIDAQQYDLAAEKLQSARQVFNQLSNFYLQLFNSFSGLDNAAAESHRKKALDTSIQRDQATYQLALVHRAQNQPELSIPLLVQIVTSQSPGIGLGRKAYEQLLEIGFVDTPYTPPNPANNQPPAPQTPPAEGQPPTGTPQPPTNPEPDTP
ncbi:MAG: tetratricopeptide repeat protein [Pleurocapsa sp.]